MADFLEERDALFINPTIDLSSLGVTEDIVLRDIPLIQIFQMLLTASDSSDRPWLSNDKEWVSKGDYFNDVATMDDPKQGSLGDCYFIAALSSVAWSRPYAIVNVATPSAWDDEHNPMYRITFYQDGSSRQSVEVSGKVPVHKSNNNYIYARSIDSGETWPAIMEKAYAKWKSNNSTDNPNYNEIVGGYAGKACAEIVGGNPVTKAFSGHTDAEIVSFIKGNCAGGRTFNPMTASTYSVHPRGIGYEKTAGIVAWHAYSLLGWMYRDNEYYAVLRNPWASSHATKDTLSGTWQVDIKNYSANIPLNRNGVFAMKVSTFTDVFRDISAVV